MVAFRRQEYLRFVFQPPERLAVQNPVAVALEIRAQVARRLRPVTPGAAVGKCGFRREQQVLGLFNTCADCQKKSPPCAESGICEMLL